MVTRAVDVAVPDGTYCTVIVQLPPAAMTLPEAQVPPVIEKAPAPLSLAIVGAAVRVSGPAVPPVAVLLTVMVPLFVVVLAVVVVKAGVGPANAAVPPRTVNVTVLEGPPPVVTLTVLFPSAAPAVIVKVVLIVVEFATTNAPWVTPVPEMVIAVAPVRLVPVRVTARFVRPRTPVLGAIVVSVGAAGATTVNVTEPVVPPPVVTVTVLPPSVAVAVMVNVAVT
jgi:hypothetical protein